MQLGLEPLVNTYWPVFRAVSAGDRAVPSLSPPVVLLRQSLRLQAALRPSVRPSARSCCVHDYA